MSGLQLGGNGLLLEKTDAEKQKSGIRTQRRTQGNLFSHQKKNQKINKADFVVLIMLTVAEKLWINH